MAPQPELLTEKQLSTISNLSVSYLRKQRRLKAGPPFFKIGKAVRYRRVEFDEWLRSLSPRRGDNASPTRCAGGEA
jgi:hypothetical protein